MRKQISSSQTDYRSFLTTLKNRVRSAQISAGRAVNRELVRLYWDIGQNIVEKLQIAGWGESVVERLATDLNKEFPNMRGFSADNLWRMRQFYLEYSSAEFLEQAVPEMEKSREVPLKNISGKTTTVPLEVIKTFSGKSEFGKAVLNSASTKAPHSKMLQLVTEVPWGHHVEILKKVKVTEARIYYLGAIAQFGWSRSVLLNQIKARTYERTVKNKKAHNFSLALPGRIAEQADEMLKSSYNLEFLGIGTAIKEREMEDRLISHLRKFILELGYGFCFIGQQHRLVLNSKEYFVDLLFYHRRLKALVAFDLKTTAFEPEHAGKMDFYLNLLNENEKTAEDQPSIGIILCAEKDDVEVEFALKTKTNPIGVAEYQLQPKLPEHFKGRLPTARQLADAMRDVLPSKQKSKRKRKPGNKTITPRKTN